MTFDRPRRSVVYYGITVPRYTPATAQTTAAARRAWAELAEAGKRLDEALEGTIDISETAALLETFVEKLDAMAACAERARWRIPVLAAEREYVQGLG